MIFAHPMALVCGLLAIPIVVLHLRSRAARRVPTAGGMFWDLALAEEPLRRAWRRWRSPASLAAKLAVLAVLVLALAEPQRPSPERTVLVIDNGDSMAAADVEPTRLAAARDVARRWLAAMNYHDQSAVIAAGTPIAVCCSMTGDIRTLGNAVDAVAATPGPSGMATAIRLAQRMTRDGRATRIVAISDGCFPHAAELLADDHIECIRVGAATGNQAIERLAVRRIPRRSAVCQILVHAANHGDSPAACRLSVAWNGKSIEEVAISVSSNGTIERIFETTQSGPGRVTAELKPSDACPSDNTVAVDVPAARSTSGDAGRDAWVLAEPVIGVGGSDLRGPPGFGQNASEFSRPAGRWPLWLFLAAGLVGMLAVEWGLYQRRWLS